MGTATETLDEIVGPFHNVAGVARLLDVTPAQVEQMRAAHEVLGLLTSDGVWVYPAWQFTGRTVRADLAPVFDVMAAAPAWSAAAWFTIGNPDLDEQTPLGWLNAGRPVDRVVLSAKHTVREWQ